MVETFDFPSDWSRLAKTRTIVLPSIKYFVSWQMSEESRGKVLDLHVIARLIVRVMEIEICMDTIEEIDCRYINRQCIDYT